MKRSSLLFWTTLIAFALWRIPSLSAEQHRGVDSSGVAYHHSMRDMIMIAASRLGVDPTLVEAIVAVESAFNPRAVSSKGARGLMQLMPQTASRYGVSDPFDPVENLTGGIRYLRDLLRRFGGALPQVLAAYNAGEAAVVMYQGIPPYRETREYVRKVLARYRPSHVSGSSSSGRSIGWAGEGARVRVEAREHFRLPDVSPRDASPASSGIDSASVAGLRRAKAHRPLTTMFRAPLVRARKVRTVLVTIRIHRYAGPREFPTSSGLRPVSRKLYPVQLRQPHSSQTKKAETSRLVR